MRTDDPANYHDWIDNSATTHNNVWNYGKEIWCNLEGRYMHIVADLSHLAGQHYSMELCSIGIMGTQYIRDETLPETIEIDSEGLMTLTIPNIYSAMSIGNQLDIKLRQASGFELSFVSLKEQIGSTLVQIDVDEATPD